MAFKCKRCERELTLYEQPEGFCDDCLRATPWQGGKYKTPETELLAYDIRQAINEAMEKQ